MRISYFCFDFILSGRGLQGRFCATKVWCLRPLFIHIATCKVDKVSFYARRGWVMSASASAWWGEVRSARCRFGSQTANHKIRWSGTMWVAYLRRFFGCVNPSSEVFCGLCWCHHFASKSRKFQTPTYLGVGICSLMLYVGALKFSSRDDRV